MSAEPAARRPRRNILMISLPLALAVAGAVVWLSGGRYETTDNANLHQARVSVASDLSGRVVAVGIEENQNVTRGETLFQVDAEPYRLALAQADASLSSARLNVEQMKAAYAVARATEAAAEERSDYYATELVRQESLTAKGVAATASLDGARNDARAATAALAIAHQQVESARAALGGNPGIEIDAHPVVVAAQVARDHAAYDLERTTVKAPADGVIYQAASFKPGQFVAAGAPLFALVETGDYWIEANFKETQLAGITPGQHAEVTFDAFPDRHLTATVETIGAGTGAEFALLPAQNATGNWVKVTQRIPVRLRLDAGSEVAGLRSGLSAEVSVDTGKPGLLAALAGQPGATE